MDKEQNLRLLAERFMQGDTSLEEERRLLRLLHGTGVPADLLSLRDMMDGLQAIALREPQCEDVAPVSRRWWQSDRLRRYVAAAVVVALVGGAGLVWHLHPESDHVVIVYGKRYADREMALKEMTQNLSFMAETPIDDVDHLLDDMFDL